MDYSLTYMHGTEVRWSDYDSYGHWPTVRQAIDGSEHRDAFMAVLDKFAAKANSHERVEVLWWTDSRIYIEIRDTRRHYPCGSMATVSFNLADGGIGAFTSAERYAAHARKGWGAFMDEIGGCTATRYTSCTDPTRPKHCPPLSEQALTRLAVVLPLVASRFSSPPPVLPGSTSETCETCEGTTHHP